MLVPGLGLEAMLRVGVVLALLLALAVVVALDRPGGRWVARARSRLLLGVPWGTLASATLVLLVYGVLQGGFERWHDPLVVPFYSWSYFAPVGVALAAFSHQGAGHLTGNLLGTLVLGSLAESAWSHYPRTRGATSFASWRTNPYVRAFVAFPAGVLVAGLLTSAFHWGPMVGFSGVVYAFAGFAIVRYPVGTLLAVLAERLVDLTYDAWRSPIADVEASSQFVTPWFVDIAVQGHLLGFLLGALLGLVLVVHRRERVSRPSALRVAGATAAFGTLLSPLWAVWYIRGADSYVLHRAAGLGMILTLGALIAVAVRATDRPLRGARGERGAGGTGSGGSDGDGSAPVPSGADRSGESPLPTRRTVATLALCLPLLVMAVVAVPVNATTVDGPPAVDGAVTVRDYTVTYAEGVTRPKTTIFDGTVLEETVLGESTRVVTGGVIVTSDAREVWLRAVSPGRLAHSGRVSVSVGGIGWRERVGVRRVGWSLLRGGSTYRVDLRPPDGAFRTVFASGPATAGVVLANRNVTVRPATGGFTVVVTRANQTLGTAPIPAPGDAVTVGGIRFQRTDGTLRAAVDGTRVPVAERSGRD
ncbi:MAG: rhomboid family intramembrane serine protease [Halobacteriaceae archaeon]